MEVKFSVYVILCDSARLWEFALVDCCCDDGVYVEWENLSVIYIHLYKLCYFFNCDALYMVLVISF